MNRRILIALIARADLDDARNLYATKFGVEGGRLLDGATQMHLSVLRALTGTERDHYDMVERAIFAKLESSEEVPKCDFEGCMNPVVMVCKCSRCESEGNQEFYVCSEQAHFDEANERHFRMRERRCVWTNL
jgi:hypothetical protein